MKKHLFVMALLSVSLLSQQSFAQVDEELASESGCLACHTQHEDLIGPAYDKVYEKYKDDPDAMDYLIQKVTNGGTGVWGELPMTPNVHIDADIIEELVEQIMHQG